MAAPRGGLQWLEPMPFWESCLLIIGFGILLRLGVGTYPYSGAGKPPMFGDYEAQRHWMEITVNLPAKEWYTNSSLNDLQYWGLDYPPLSAYQSWVVGMIARETNPELVALTTSRGIETYETKLFMRWSVIATDMLFFLPAVVLFIVTFYPRSRRTADGLLLDPPPASARPPITRACQLWALAVLVLQPSLILIDHGHFQYNNISLGLTVAAVASIIRHHPLLGSALFSLALNHKQMSLYYAPAFFAHLLGTSLRSRPSVACLKIAQLGTAVVAMFVVCWLPYLSSLDASLAVLHRVLPFSRGLYEDYVSNFWCVSSLVIKWRRLLPLASLTKLCAAATILAAAPSMAHQIAHPSRTGFLYSLANSGFAFYLFSFQVHEKSILLPLLPVLMLALHEPVLALWVSGVAAFSMVPLLERDGLNIPYAATLLVFFSLLARSCPSHPLEGPTSTGGRGSGVMGKEEGGCGEEDQEHDFLGADTRGVGGGAAWKSDSKDQGVRNYVGASSALGPNCAGRGKAIEALCPSLSPVLQASLSFSVLGALGLHAAPMILPPPPSLPWLYPALQSAFSFAHFVAFAAYTNWRQWQLRGDMRDEGGATGMGRGASYSGIGGSPRDSSDSKPADQCDKKSRT
eukprot:jgi/Mesvir1/5251/Mv15370-RA.1